jgi:hypothetical protein
MYACMYTLHMCVYIRECERMYVGVCKNISVYNESDSVYIHLFCIYGHISRYVFVCVNANMYVLL